VEELGTREVCRREEIWGVGEVENEQE